MESNIINIIDITLKTNTGLVFSELLLLDFIKLAADNDVTATGAHFLLVDLDDRVPAPTAARDLCAPVA